MNQLSLGRAYLQEICQQAVDWHDTNNEIPNTPAPDLMLYDTALDVSLVWGWFEQAVTGLHKAGDEDMLRLGLLARSACARFAHDWQQAHSDLKHVFESARRSDMLLHLCDAHLEAARLALLGHGLDELSATTHLDEAAALIEKTGYKRRLLDLDYLRNY